MERVNSPFLSRKDFTIKGNIRVLIAPKILHEQLWRLWMGLSKENWTIDVSAERIDLIQPAAANLPMRHWKTK
jgi:hypothetical protein